MPRISELNESLFDDVISDVTVLNAVFMIPKDPPIVNEGIVMKYANDNKHENCTFRNTVDDVSRQCDV